MPEPVLECPACSQRMRPAASGKDQVWLCDECGNFFMPARSFEGLVEQPLSGHALPAEDGAVSCPGCKGAMSGAEVKGAQIDYCPRCEMVLSDRTSFSYIIDHSSHSKPMEKALLGMDVARNLSTAFRAEPVPKLKVDNLFILYRNGILITSYAPDVPKDMDRDVVGSMLMAVTEFVQTSFKGLGGTGPLSSIRFGDREIAFEHGRYLVLALTLKGELGSDVRKKLSAALKAVEARNDHLLHSWDGNLGDLTGILDSFGHVVEPVRAAG